MSRASHAAAVSVRVPGIAARTAVAAARTRDLQLRLVKQPTQVRLAPARDKKLLVVDAMVRHTRDPLPPSREINK